MGMKTRHDVVLVPAGQGDEERRGWYSPPLSAFTSWSVPSPRMTLASGSSSVISRAFSGSISMMDTRARFNQKPSQIKGDAAAPMIITLVIFTIFLPRARKKEVMVATSDTATPGPLP